LSILHGALRTDADGNYVFQLTGGRIQKTPVTVGAVNVDRAEITHGLKEGDTVALNAEDNRELRDGMPAKPARKESSNSGFLDLLRSRALSQRAR
jgi:multidrug efflux pump subunit AcrA (membrane-fusion protein)